MNIVDTDQILGATVTGVDLRQPLSKGDFAALLRALGRRGVLRFPGQLISPAELRQFSSRFGQLQVLTASKHTEPGMPDVTILSNIVQDGKAIGSADAGQFWHTDMSYNAVIGFVNVLVAHAVPMRDGKALGATEFTNTQAAYEDLPEATKRQLRDASAIHDLNKSWEWLRKERNSPRAPLTEQERKERPPVPHPVFLSHPISGRKVIYVNPNTAVNIVGMTEEDSKPILDALYAHILQPKYRYRHQWALGDLLMWDHVGTWHQAIADYGPDEHRLMKRCQVMADRIFDPQFVREALAA